MNSTLTPMTSLTRLTRDAAREGLRPELERPRRVSLLPPCPQGVLVGRCSGWVDLGMQANRFEKGAKPQRRVLITWTLEGPAGERWRVSKEFSWCAGPRSALRKLLEEWRGRPYAADDEAWAVLRDPRKVLEQPGLVRVVHRPPSEPGKAPWPEVAGVWPLMKGVRAEALKWPPTLYLPGSPGAEEVLRGLPGWVRARCVGVRNAERSGPAAQDSAT